MSKRWNVFAVSRMRVLKIVLLLLGCLVFLLSMISPFYLLHAPGMSFPICSNSLTYYWSFKSFNEKVEFLNFPPIVPDPQETLTEYWFSDCWYSDYFIERLDLSKTLMAMFALQILTLLAGGISIFARSRLFALFPTVLCIAVILTMIHACVIFSSTYALDNRQQGYWLTYPSLFLFLSASIMSAVSTKQVARSLNQVRARSVANLEKAVCRLQMMTKSILQQKVFNQWRLDSNLKRTKLSLSTTYEV